MWKSTTLEIGDLGSMATLDHGTGGTQFRNNNEADARYARVGATNTFNADQTINGNLTVTGTIQAGG